MPSPTPHSANRDHRNRRILRLATAAIAALTIGDAASSLMAGAIGRTPEDPAWRYSLAVTGWLGVSSLAIGLRQRLPRFPRWPMLWSHLALALVIMLLLLANITASLRRPWTIGLAIGWLLWLLVSARGRQEWPVALVIGLDVAGAAIAESLAVGLGIWAIGWAGTWAGGGLAGGCLAMVMVALAGLRSAWRVAR